MGARSYNLCGHWRNELATLEYNFKQLEEQCCPPEEAVAREKVWTPAATGDRAPPTVEHQRIALARPGTPLRIEARVTDPSGVQSVRLRYRHVTQFEEYQTLEMTPTNRPNEYAVTLPGDALSPKWDFMYFIEAIDKAGAGVMWPDFMKEAPY